ncbi:MAG: hypothetical protein K9K75_03980 [Deltaproteobacteria bacterium]|nr:hypothetical protein [Deltaproteobacteria bacterium]
MRMLELRHHPHKSVEEEGSSPAKQNYHTMLREFTSKVEYAKSLGWLNSPQEMLADYAGGIKQRIAALLLTLSPRCVVLIGMGGSVMGALALTRLFGDSYVKRLLIIDTTNPVALARIGKTLDYERDVFIVASKSGTTSETTALMDHFFNQAKEALGATNAPARFIAITDPQTVLHREAKDLGFADIFLSNPLIGGRFSLFTPFAIVPAALSGCAVEPFLQRVGLATTDEISQCWEKAGALATVMARLSQEGKRKIILRHSPALKGFALWLEQLIAESTGKGDKALLPVINASISTSARATLNSPAKDEIVVFALGEESDLNLMEDIAWFQRHGVDVWESRIGSSAEAGLWFYFWMIFVSVYCENAGINPFDQPDVELTKDFTRQCLAEEKGAREVPAPDAATSLAMLLLLQEFLERVQDGAEYIAIICGLDYEGDQQALTLVERLRDFAAKISGRWTTINLLPRYLHSTGQLHKGDAGNGVFIFLTEHHANTPDHEALNFTRLFAAQVQGDILALKERSRKVLHIRLTPSTKEQLGDLLLSANGSTRI